MSLFVFNVIDDRKIDPAHELFPGNHTNHDPEKPAFFSGWLKPFEGDDVESITVTVKLYTRNDEGELTATGFAVTVPVSFIPALGCAVWSATVPADQLEADTDYTIKATPSGSDFPRRYKDFETA